MDPGSLVRHALEVLIVVAVGGMLVSAVVRLGRGQVRVYRCVACRRPTSRAYPECRHCRAPQPARGPRPGARGAGPGSAST